MGRTGATWSRPDWGRGPFRRPSSGSLLPSRPGGNAAAQTLEGAGWLEHLKARHLVACHDVEQLQQVFPEKYRDMRARGVRSFYAVALLEEGELRGYLGIDNPRERLECTTMLLSLSHFLMGERSKREGKAQNASSAATTP